MSHHAANNPTKKSLANSLKKLVATKPLSKISVYEIVRDCGVNRQTFYYHFHDIFDLLEWIFREEALAFCKDRGESPAFSACLLHLLAYIRENEALCLCTLKSAGREHLKKLFCEGLNQVILTSVAEHSADLNVSDKDKAFIAHFYTLSFAGLIENWMREGLKEEPEEIVRRCEIIMRGSIRAALERFSADTKPPAQEAPAER